MSSKNACPGSLGLFPLGTTIQMLGLALMAGGMLALGAFTAPAVFGGLPRDAAAPIMAMIFRRYDVVLLVSLALVLVGEAFRWSRASSVFHKTKLALTRYVLIAGLTVGVLYSTQGLNPEIERLNRAGVHRGFVTAEGRQFEALHKQSENFYKLNLLLAVLIILLTPFADSMTAKAEDSPKLADANPEGHHV